ncbi:MAG TPA: Uma2 family endonuclease [Gemmatimonadaceae bacterium]|nr:Uma2 family endonuclease [Gemmatimonadaceae bacterium]
MAMSAPPRSYTARMVRALNDQHDWGWPRYEVVDGELLVTPAPRLVHQLVADRLLFALTLYLEREPIGQALTSPADISWAPKKLVQPDVFVIPIEEARKLRWPAVRQLLLAVEVLSRGSRRHDREVKRALYQREGVPLYWIIDPKTQTAEIWTPEAKKARVEREVLRWHPAGTSEPFTLALEELFRPI